MDDRGNEVVVRAALPGFEEKDLEVQLHDNLLMIRAERQEEGQERCSRSYRTVTLPADTDPDKAQATYRSGVREHHLPRTEPGRGKRIAAQGQQAGTPAQEPGQPATQVRHEPPRSNGGTQAGKRPGPQTAKA